MRLFVAVNLSEDIKSRLLEIQSQLRSRALRGNFTRPENLHLTLAFLGETPEGKLEKLFRMMEEIHRNQRFPQKPFDVVFNRCGCFTHSRKELWWIGADRDCPGLPLLEAIHGQLLELLDEGDFAVDKRPFSAHITLAREVKLRQPEVLDCPKITVRVDHISLMESGHIRGVLTYTELMRRQLSR